MTSQADRPPDQPGAILVIDDEPAILDVTTELLTLCGYPHFVAQTSQTSMQLLRDHSHIDVVLADVNLGNGEDGFAMAERIHQGGWPGAFVIVSGDPDAFAGKRGQLPRAQFLMKPYGRTALIKAIDAARAMRMDDNA